MREDGFPPALWNLTWWEFGPFYSLYLEQLQILSHMGAASLSAIYPALNQVVGEGEERQQLEAWVLEGFANAFKEGLETAAQQFLSRQI